MKIPDISPCPFCGAKEPPVAGIDDQDGYKVKVQCDRCEAEGPAVPGGNFEPKNKSQRNKLIAAAIEKWNTRRPA